MNFGSVDILSVLLWAQIVLLWAAVNYLFVADPVPDGVSRATPSPPLRSRWIIQIIGRSIAAGIVADVLSIGHASLALGVFVLALSVTLPLLRVRAHPSLIGEAELLTNAVFVLGIYGIVFGARLVARFGAGLSTNKVAAGCLVFALFLFVLRGGTYVVRGLLAKCGTLPPLQECKPQNSSENECVDYTEINRGRLIGNLERILLTIMVAGGSYAALAFLVAAKGLIRSKNLEERNWAEYFLVGTLASVLVALGVGLCIRLVVKVLWHP